MQTNKHKKLLSGFTLIELLLVILIMGIISTATFSLYGQYSLNAKINTTAQQMQTILQAGSSYYIDRGTWPLANDSTFRNLYLTPAIQTNPWGNNYSWGLSPTGQKKFQVFSGALPNPTNLASNPLPQRIVNLLPAAIIDSSSNQVLAETTLPKKTIASQTSYEIRMIQTISEQSDGATPTFNSFTCPAGWTGTGVALPSYYDFENYSSCMFGSRTFANLAAPVTCTQSENTFNCSATVAINGNYLLWYTVPLSCLWSRNGAFGSVGFTFIGWCYKNSSANS